MCVIEDCHVGYCSVGCDKYRSLDAERVTAMVLQAVSLDQWKWCDPLGILFYKKVDFVTYGFYFISFGFLVLCADVHIILKNNFHTIHFHVFKIQAAQLFETYCSHQISTAPPHLPSAVWLLAMWDIWLLVVRYIWLLVVRCLKDMILTFLCHRRPSDPLGLARKGLDKFNPATSQDIFLPWPYVI